MFTGISPEKRIKISWKKGFQDSRIQGFKYLFSNDFIRNLNILSTYLISPAKF